MQKAEDHRNEKQGRDRRDDQTTYHRATERRVLFAAVAKTESHRDHADDHRRRGHNDRTQTTRPGFPCGLNRILSFLEVIAGEGYDKD